MLFEGFCDIFSRWNTFKSLFLKIDNFYNTSISHLGDEEKIEKHENFIDEYKRLKENKVVFEDQLRLEIKRFEKIYKRNILEIKEDFRNYCKVITIKVNKMCIKL